MLTEPIIRTNMVTYYDSIFSDFPSDVIWN